MRIDANINLHALIYHRLSPPDAYLLSSRPITLRGDNDPLRKFFGKHIRNSLNGGGVRVASFLNKDGTISKCCNAILLDESALVAESKLLAERLFAAVTSYKGNISKGNLGVCVYSIEGTQTRSLAILKLDPDEVVRPVVVADPAGDYIELEQQPDALPSTHTDLQKCAFIDIPLAGDNLEVLVVDHQSRYYDEPAGFFVSDFLECGMKFDDAKRTREFQRVARAAHSKLSSRLSSKENELLSLAVYSALQSTHVIVDTWLSQVPIQDENIKREFEDEVQKKLRERNFDVDPVAAGRITSRIIYGGDDGLRVIFQPQQLSSHSINFEDETVDGEKTGYKIVSIRTRKWEPISQ